MGNDLLNTVVSQLLLLFFQINLSFKSVELNLMTTLGLITFFTLTIELCFKIHFKLFKQKSLFRAHATA